jgi:ubiquinone biosynthesis protein COQ9
MTTDHSENFEDTWAFLDRRLNNVQTLGKLTGNVSEYLSFTGHALKNIANSRGMRF